MTISTTSDAGSTPTVTVVIPAYNAARYIAQALDSVHAQTFRDFEVIVVDDGSNDRDELERILHAHPLSIIYLTQPNKGVSAARNAALRVAKGKFYAQLDADDQWLPQYLEVQLGLLEENPDVVLVYPNATIIADESDVQLEFMAISPSQGEVNFESLVRQKCTVMTCVTARMDAIRNAGMFDETLRSCEDFDLWLRIVKNGGRIIYHRRVLVLYRRHQGSLSSDRVWMTRNLLAVFEKCASTFDLTGAEREILNEQINHNGAMLGLFEGKHALRAGGASAALLHFKRANEHLRNPKLVLVIFLLRHVPRLVIWTFVTRERLLMSNPDHQLTGIDEPHATETAGDAHESRVHFLKPVMQLDVIIPTYNRQDLLPFALNSLFRAEIPSGLEVVVTVVDNNSTDGTRAVVERFQQQFGDRIRYCFERQQGRSHALNAGIKATSGELIGVIDDDEEIDPSWYKIAFEAFSTRELDFIGGPYVPRWSTTPPEWLPSNYGAVVGSVDGGEIEVPFDSNYPGILMGGNAVFTRAILLKVGLYSTWLGRTDKGLLSGEDEELYGRLLASGARGMYLPQLKIYHHVPPERLTKKYFRSWCFWRGVSLGLLERTRRQPCAYLFGLPRWQYRSAARGLVSGLSSLFVRPKEQRQAFASELGLWDFLGLFYGRHFRR